MKIAVRAILVVSIFTAFSLTTRATSATAMPALRATPISVEAAIPHSTYPAIPHSTYPATPLLADPAIPHPADPATPPSADEIVKQACTEAAASHKKVMVIFHASWCSWCHKLDTMMATPECKPLFDQSFVVCHLDIAESPDKLALENPGAEELYAKYANQNCGIPFYLIMDPDGTVIADSRIKSHGVAPTGKGDNTGFPGSKPEMEYFLRTLRETTALTPAQLKIIKERFTKK